MQQQNPYAPVPVQMQMQPMQQQPAQSYPVGVYQPTQQAAAYPTFVQGNSGYPTTVQMPGVYPTANAGGVAMGMPLGNEMMPMVIMNNPYQNSENVELREANNKLNDYGCSQCLNVTYMVLYVLGIIIFTIFFIILCIIAAYIANNNNADDNPAIGGGTIAFVIVLLLWCLFTSIRAVFGFYGCLKAYHSFNRRENVVISSSLRIYIAMGIWEIVTIIIMGALTGIGGGGVTIILLIIGFLMGAGDIYMYIRLREYRVKLEVRDALRSVGYNPSSRM
jgi:hypothetical protein